VNTPRLITVDPYGTADLLRRALTLHGISADVHGGYGLALVSVWVGLVVWCDGYTYWWRAGWNAQRSRVLYARHPAVEPERAARRVAGLYVGLRNTHPYTEMVADLVADVNPPSGGTP
jgi:hypothetical protein